MGTNYSQPPRGYLYSDRSRPNPNYDGKPTPEFGSFSQLFFNNFDAEKTLTFLETKTRSYSVLDCLKISQEFERFLQSNKFSKQSKIAFYSESTIEANLAIICSLIIDCSIILSSPTSQPINDFLKSVKSQSPHIVICSPQYAKPVLTNLPKALLVTTAKSIHTSFHDIINTGLAHSSNIQPEVTSSPGTITFLTPTPATITFDQSMIYLREWSEKFKLCRDARITSLLPIDDNLHRLILYLSVYNRCCFNICNKLEEVKSTDPTHMFLPLDIFRSHCESIENTISQNSVLYRGRYNLSYYWKRFWITWGSRTPSTDRAVFNPLCLDFGSDMRFAFCNELLTREEHELWTVVYGKPMCPVFLPEQWGNVGASLPCDVRYTKFGTVGGAVGNAIACNEETKKLRNEADGSEIDVVGFWDEEGSLVIGEK
ncbi:AMP-binding enzyme family protein [Histomonas meleagridis]|uniref:AMP-binding enzyme family protein n=1 Tax=Histomonas meleagridis TaxID=135588 RepID=UPI00355A133D|nr:AMP-binding enzyme family protein [Histomonas meleagridis]KAH0804720.1 AMP-binding enzyme family protein [Histomonas meleagridis]